MHERRYLLLKGFSGMGNRLRALAEAVVYARLSDRVLLIDWNDSLYSSDGKDVFHRLFDLPAAGTISVIPQNASVAPAIWIGQLERSFDSMIAQHHLRYGTDARTALSIDPDRDYSETVAVMYDFTFRLPRLVNRPAPCPDDWRGLDATDLLRTLLREYVRLNARVAARVEQFARAHFRRPTIGVHIRQTDNMFARNIHRKGISVSAIDATLEQWRRAVPNAALFIATDNRAVEDDFRRRYEGVVFHPKWHPRTPGQAIHGHAACPDKLRAAEDALVDLYLLARCDILIYSSRATFAQCAADISTQPADRHVDVGAPPRPGEAVRWIAKQPWWDGFPRRHAHRALRRARQAAGGVLRRLRQAGRSSRH